MVAATLSCRFCHACGASDAALHRDIWYLHEQRVRVRLEQVQEELDLATAQRRDAESEARVGLGSRVRRRRSDDPAQ